MGTKYNKSYISSISYAANRKVSVSSIILYVVVHQQFIMKRRAMDCLNHFEHENDNWNKHTFSATKSVYTMVDRTEREWEALIEIEVAWRSTRLNWIIIAIQLDFIAIWNARVCFFFVCFLQHYTQICTNCFACLILSPSSLHFDPIDVFRFHRTVCIIFFLATLPVPK